MDAGAVLEVFGTADWSGPFAPAEQERAVAALEGGKVLVFPHLAFAIEADEQKFTTPDAGSASRKNVSFDPRTGRVGGTSVEGEGQTRLGAMLQRYAGQAERLVQALIPRYVPALERARTSFRPVEIAGRSTTPRHDDKLLHVDAFPTRPMHGRRILRVFTNVAADGAPRQWRVGEPFPDFARKFFPALRRPVPLQGLVMQQLGLTKGRRSLYDHFMLRLHDVGKLDAVYQAGAPQAAVSFAPGTTWMCFTDSVLHAAMAGHHALEQTFHLPVEQMADPARSPLRVLERMASRALV